MKQDMKTASQNATADDSSGAAPADVPCGACTGKRKQNAKMFCRLCLTSFCETHLQGQCEVPPLKKHKLVETSIRMKESFCNQHKKSLQIFCKTDQQLLCWVCALNEHRDHDIEQVPKQPGIQVQLDKFKQEIQNRMVVLEGNEAELKEATNSVKGAALKVCKDFEQVCKEQVRLFTQSMEAACSDMREKVNQTQKSALDSISRDLQRLRREASELQDEKDKIGQLSRTPDPIEFLQGFQAYKLPVFTDSCERSNLVKEFVTAQENNLKILSEKQMEELFNQPALTRECKDAKTPEYDDIKKSPMFLCDRPQLKLDLKTAANGLYLSNNKKWMSRSGSGTVFPDHPDRFTHFHQVLCEKGLTGEHYWEVMWDAGVIEVAVSYEDIERKGYNDNCCFGHNEFSWKLKCGPSSCTFWHNNSFTDQIPPVQSSRLGVHLDYHKGTLAFYNVSESYKTTLLHQIQTTFTRPLFPGFSVDLDATLTICNI